MSKTHAIHEQQPKTVKSKHKKQEKTEKQQKTQTAWRKSESSAAGKQSDKYRIFIVPNAVRE